MRSLPTYVEKLTRGEWSCFVPGPLPAGNAQVGGGFARKLGDAFVLVGAQNGDLVRMTFDLPERRLEVRIGGNELLDNPMEAPGPYLDDDPDDLEDVAADVRE